MKENGKKHYNEKQYYTRHKNNNGSTKCVPHYQTASNIHYGNPSR